MPLALFGLFLAFQTTTLRFTFDDAAFSLVKADLSTTGENVVVGGENVWSYKSFVNYDFFPSESLPILVYFKETQTPKEFWNVGPGEQANSEEALAKGAVPGQVHFFPAIAYAARAFERSLPVCIVPCITETPLHLMSLPFACSHLCGRRVDVIKAGFIKNGCAKL